MTLFHTKICHIHIIKSEGIVIYKKPSRQFNTNEVAEEIEYTQVEKGVRVIKARPNRHGGTDGDCYLFKLDEMTDEAIMRYGLRGVKEKYERGETS